MKRTEAVILRTLLRGEPYLANVCSRFGRRERAVAEKLQADGLAKIVDKVFDSQQLNRYAVIPPEAEWDHAGMCIADSAAAEIAKAQGWISEAIAGLRTIQARTGATRAMSNCCLAGSMADGAERLFPKLARPRAAVAA